MPMVPPLYILFRSFLPRKIIPLSYYYNYSIVPCIIPFPLPLFKCKFTQTYKFREKPLWQSAVFRFFRKAHAGAKKSRSCLAEFFRESGKRKANHFSPSFAREKIPTGEQSEPSHRPNERTRVRSVRVKLSKSPQGLFDKIKEPPDGSGSSSMFTSDLPGFSSDFACLPASPSRCSP